MTEHVPGTCRCCDAARMRELAVKARLDRAEGELEVLRAQRRAERAPLTSAPSLAYRLAMEQMS